MDVYYFSMVKKFISKIQIIYIKVKNRRIEKNIEKINKKEVDSIALPERKYIFTYSDYLLVTGQIEEYKRVKDEVERQLEEYRLKDELQCNEESAEYILDKKHDKMFKEILHNKEEMKQFIKEFILCDFNGELELQNGEYITKSGNEKLVDILYRVKEEDIYFLIEHQTKIDYNMPFRMLEYSIEISRRAIKNMSKHHEEYKYPLILPIVIYTGNRKWSVSTKYSDKVAKIPGNYIKGIDIEYKVIDINEFEIDELLRKNTNLAKAMVIEKCKNPKELFECFNKIINSSITKTELEEVRELLKYLYEKIEVNDLKKIISIIEEKEEDNMSTIQERVRDWFNEAEANRNEAIAKANEAVAKLNKAEAKASEAETRANEMTAKADEAVAKLNKAEAKFKEMEKETKRETLKEVIIRMLRIQLTYDTIEQLTGASVEEIEKVRDELICKKN